MPAFYYLSSITKQHTNSGVQVIAANYPQAHYNIMICFKSVLLLLLCLQRTHALNGSFQAINASTVNVSYLISNSTPYEMSIPAFSYISIEVDLRHISSLSDLKGTTLSLFIQNREDLKNLKNYTENLTLAASVNSYRLYAVKQIFLSAKFIIQDSSSENINARGLLLGKSMSALVTPAAPLPQKQASFLFVTKKQDRVNLAYNRPKKSQFSEFTGYFLSSIPDSNNKSSRPSSNQSYNDYWSELEQIVTPYLPYISNCDNSGDYLYFSQMIHNDSECELFGYESIPINQFKFGSQAKSDNCSISRSCMYDEIPANNSAQPFWNTLGGTTKNLFYITKEEYVAPLLANYRDQSLVPCSLEAKGNNQTSSQYPGKITIQIGYYQESASKRRIETCEVKFSLYSNSAKNFAYELELHFKPLTHTQILLNFGFEWYIYMIVFVMIGLISNAQFLIFYVYHYFTSVKRRITLRILVCLRLFKEIFRGVFSAVCIILFLIFFVEVVMNGTFFGKKLAGPFWDYLVFDDIGNSAADSLQSTRAARFGLSEVVVSIYLAWKVANQLVGKERSNKEYQDYEILGRKFKPFEWNKGKIMHTSLLIVVGSSAFIYFTYSQFFQNHIWFFIVSMQVAQMVLEEVFHSLYGDALPCLHMKVTVGVIAYLASMGASDLSAFIMGYLIDVAISTIEIAYLTQIQEKITKFVEEKNEEMHKLYLALLNDEEEEADKNNAVDNSLLNNSDEVILENILNKVSYLDQKIEQQHYNVDINEFEPTHIQTELKQKFVRIISERHKQSQYYKAKSSEQEKKREDDGLQEKLEKENKKLELLIDATASVVQYMAQPIVVLILWITYESSKILNSYQIPQSRSVLYFLSSIILAFFYLVNIIIVINVLEVYFNFDYKKLIEKLLRRFEDKKTFWIADQNCEEHELQHVQTQLRSSYKYSLSAQMYFVVAMFTFAMYIFIIGFHTILSSKVNIFKDPYVVLIVFFWISVLSVLERLLHKLVYYFDIWGCQKYAEKNMGVPQTREMDADQATGQSLMHASSSKMFTFKQGQQEVKEVQEIIERERIQKKVFQSKLETMCKSLNPLFENQDFKLQYAIKNKQFIRERIDKILPLVKSFPENDSNLLGKSSSLDVPALKKKTKNVDPMISDLIGGWLKRVENNTMKRKENGVQIERRLKKCNFCFKTWAIYHGYQGTCLECSKIIFDGCRNQKKE